MATSTQATKTTKGLYGANLIEYIIGRAKELHLDPAAVLSVATTEGGFSGAVGDQGTSFGPFQLHQGGRLPAGLSAQQAQAFANSPAGVDYALRGIAGVANGQTGTTAIASIVSRFEQPLHPAPEIATASARYSTVQGEVKIAEAEKAGIGGSGVGAKGGTFDRILRGIFTAPAQVFQGVTGHNVNASPTGPTSVLGAAGATGSGLANFLGVALPSNAIVRGGEIVAGGVLVLLGLIMIVLGGRGAPAAQTRRAVGVVR